MIFIDVDFSYESTVQYLLSLKIYLSLIKRSVSSLDLYPPETPIAKSPSSGPLDTETLRDEKGRTNGRVPVFYRRYTFLPLLT